MKLLFLMINYPDVRQGYSSLYTDLTAKFAEKGHEVYVVTQLLEGTKTIFEKEKEVDVLRVKTRQLFNVNPIKKGIAYLLLPIQFKKAIVKHFEKIKFDAVITPTPPITFGSVAKWVKKKDDAKHYLILRDIFPQNAKDLKLINNNILFNFFRKEEKQIYAMADAIGCMSQGNIDYIKKHNPEVDTQKLHLLPNWITPTSYTEPIGKIKQKHGLQGKFVAIFGGNIGMPQQLEFLLQLAERKKENPQIVFLIIGNGTERKRLENLAKEKNLNNVIFKNTILAEDYHELVKECEVGLICLSERFTIPNIPSKTLSYFNAKIPVLAAVDKNTDYGQILENANAGLWSITGDIDTYEQNFDQLYNNEKLRKEMGENGYIYLNNYLTSEISYFTIISKL